MSNELLISASMLSALWDKQRNDTIDLLKPFVEYAIGKRYRKGQMVEVSAIQYELESTLGYEKMPRGVVDIILNRLSPQTLTKEHGCYKLAANLSDEVRKHEERRITVKERREKVGDELAAYLNERKLVRTYDQNSAIDALVLLCVSNTHRLHCTHMLNDVEYSAQMYN